MNTGRIVGTFDFEPLTTWLEDEPTSTPEPEPEPAQETVPVPELEPVGVQG